MNKKFYIETFGCQMNKSDSDLMTVSLKKNGYTEADDISDATVVIFNTCSVRQHAEDRVISRIQSAKNEIHKRDGKIIVTGCMAQRIGKDLLNDKIADIVIGPYQSPAIGEILDGPNTLKIDKNHTSQDLQDFRSRISDDTFKERDLHQWHEWVTITHGCENFCSYCIVPYVRGRLISFKSDKIISYIGKLADKGIQEITLLGQNVNQYGMDMGDIPFYKLLEAAARTSGLKRINFLTSHPKDFSENIIKVIRDNGNISRSIHLPLQSGSSNTLKRMNRKYTMEHYMSIVENISRELDEYSITTDLIVGFPGESDEDYMMTLDAVKKIRFDDAFMYAYSPREGTPAFKLEESLDRDEKVERLNRLIGIQRAISLEKLESRIGHIDTVIPEKISKRSQSEIMGKSFLNHPVVLPGSSDDIGKEIRVKIQGVRGSTLQGSAVE